MSSMSERAINSNSGPIPDSSPIKRRMNSSGRDMPASIARSLTSSNTCRAKTSISVDDSERWRDSVAFLARPSSARVFHQRAISSEERASVTGLRVLPVISNMIYFPNQPRFLDTFGNKPTREAPSRTAGTKCAAKPSRESANGPSSSSFSFL